MFLAPVAPRANDCFSLQVVFRPNIWYYGVRYYRINGNFGSEKKPQYDQRHMIKLTTGKEIRDHDRHVLNIEIEFGDGLKYLIHIKSYF